MEGSLHLLNFHTILRNLPKPATINTLRQDTRLLSLAGPPFGISPENKMTIYLILAGLLGFGLFYKAIDAFDKI